MKIIKYPNKFKKNPKAIILGSFESIHNGHMELINYAKKNFSSIAMMMFSNPENLPNIKTKPYAPLMVRLQNAANLGIDYVMLVEFNNDLKNVEGKAFIKNVLEMTNNAHIIVGKDFSCGKFASYKANQIKKDFENVTIIDFKKINDQKISTSILKELAEIGDVQAIKKVSPFSFAIEERISAKNIFNISNFKPHTGIYAAWAIVKDIRYWAVVRIGFQNNEIVIPDLNIKNFAYDCTMLLQKCMRKIIKVDQDKIDDLDKPIAQLFLSKL